jgi:hypothetical protein
MAFLFIGGEMEDFVAFGSVTPELSVSGYRTSHARMAVNASGGAWGVNYIRAPFTAGSSIGLTARVHTGSTSISASQVFLWLASGGSARLRLRTNTTHPTTLILESYTSGGVATTLATSTNTITFNSVYKLDLLVSYGAAGRARLWVDGVLFIDTGTMDITASGSTTLDSANFGNVRSAGQNSPWSEVIVTDGEDPRPLNLKTLVPNATGDVTGWTSGAWGDIDEYAASDTDLAVSDTANQVLTVNCTGMPTGWGGLTVRAVKSVALCARGATGPSKLALGLRQSSTNGFATAQTLDTGYGPVSTTWTANPVTGLAFTPAEIEAIQLAYRSET